jgi:hypothetical protein
MTTDAISAIKSYYQTLSPEQQQNMLKNLGISDISAINIIDMKVAENYCKSNNIQCDLGNNSAWVQYDNAKANWNTRHEQYLAANSIFKKYKATEATAQGNYNTKVSEAMTKNGGLALSSAEDSAIRRNTGYTQETINNTKNAELAANMLLDKCFQEVDNQRAGLAFGTLADGFIC